MKQTEIENIQVFVWSAIDVENKECLAIWVSKGRSSFETYVFLRKVLKYCKNRPEFVVDKGPWYPWAFKVLRLRYRHETFGSRNAVEGFFSKLKERAKGFWERFPHNSSFNSSQSWLESFVAFHNLWRSLI